MLAFLVLKEWILQKFMEPMSCLRQRESLRKVNKMLPLIWCPTYYSTQGSTLCIQTMCTILCQDAKSKGKKPKILAGRNAHRSFIHAAALLDFEIEWLYGNSDYLSCTISTETLEKEILENNPTAVYLTNPDYLGNLLDIKSLASICKKHDVLLAIDNAHGAYLRFFRTIFTSY